MQHRHGLAQCFLKELFLSVEYERVIVLAPLQVAEKKCDKQADVYNPLHLAVVEINKYLKMPILWWGLVSVVSRR